jgi:hypothetical protein
MVEGSNVCSERGERCPPLTLSVGEDWIEESLKSPSKLDRKKGTPDKCKWQQELTLYE